MKYLLAQRLQARRGPLPAACRALACALALVAGAPIRAQADTAAPAVLQLAGDAYVSGDLLGSADATVVNWQSPLFAGPFQFDLAAVDGVRFPAAEAERDAEGEYCFELTGGDRLFGALVRLGDEEVELDETRFGRLHVRRDRIRRFHRWEGADVLYSGPNGLSGWKDLGRTREWDNELGRPFTTRKGAALFADLGLPARAAVELEVSWPADPDFTLGFGASGESAGAAGAAGMARLEVWRRADTRTLRVLAADARAHAVEWAYTFRRPGSGWQDPAFDAGDWAIGAAGFGRAAGHPRGAVIRTEWDTARIWMRRNFTVEETPARLGFWIYHRQDVRVWINGQVVYDGERSPFTEDYDLVEIDAAAAKLVRRGENTIAVESTHKYLGAGSQYIDVGIVDRGAIRGDLVAVRETAEGAEVAALLELGVDAGRTRLVAYIDQEAGRLLVYAPDGTQLADLEVPAAVPEAHGGLLLRNYGGGVRLERLRVSTWNGVAPREVDPGRPHVRFTDGSIVYGRLEAAAPGAERFRLHAESGATEVDAAEVTAVTLSPGARDSLAAFQAVYQDGSQISGELRGIHDDRFDFASPGIDERVRVPFAGLRALIATRGRAAAAPPPSPPRVEGRVWTLEMPGVRLPGQLTDGRATEGATCLVWQPSHSRRASPLLPGMTGRITYEEEEIEAEESTPPRFAGLVKSLIERFWGVPDVEAIAAAPEHGRKAMYLRNGDSFPVEVSYIDQNGVSFETPLAAGTFVANDRVKAVELVASEGPPRLSRAKRERLLMLPRMQRPSPPTHLIRSTRGDFLRARVSGMDEDTLRFELRMENMRVPRDRVSHLIWLHKEEVAREKAEAAPGEAPPEPGASPQQDSGAPPEPARSITVVQVRGENGDQLTFRPEELSGSVLSGTSDILGACRIDLTEANQVWIGEATEVTPPDLAYGRWKLYDAEDPLYIQMLEGPLPERVTPGTDSPLVGEVAPDFELDLLRGGQFRLSEHKGKVIVLDFWATWCGPCLLTMPEIDRAVKEVAGLRDEGEAEVELIAVNLEESAHQITPLLERHKLEMTVALDRDGVVASRYQVTAIPQTVIIDSAGKIARLFVGGGSQLGTHVRNAVSDLSHEAAAGGAGDRPARGTPSALVGQAAPEFELELLEGGKFHLAQRRGRVVVLDFWASWCGPCMQAMPQIHRVVEELDDPDLDLIAVNLRESEGRIQAALERLKLEVTVVLDREGAVAGAYQVSGIPQTVVIGRDGNVAQVFIGGGPQLGENLRLALRETLATPAAASEEGE